MALLRLHGLLSDKFHCYDEDRDTGEKERERERERGDSDIFL
jgi:hypothetical protein